MSERSFLLFKSGGRSFACDFTDILRIEPSAGSEITFSPGFPLYMPGTVTVEGEVIPVIDGAKRFGLDPDENRERSCFIITYTEQGGAMSSEYKKCALLVDSVIGSVKLEEDRILPPPDLNRDSFVRYISGVFLLDGETCYIISPQKTICG